MNHFIKQSPITGLAGFGGGSSGLTVSGSAAGPVWYGNRVTVGGGYWNNGSGQAYTSVDISYYDITTSSNAADFGDMSRTNRPMDARASNGVRGVHCGGYSAALGTEDDIIDYITFATTGNATDFGDMTQVSTWVGGSDGSRAVIQGAHCNPCGSPWYTDTINYFSIDTTGNASDFGNQDIPRYSMGGCGEGIYGFSCGGHRPSRTDHVSRLVIQTTGDSTGYSELSVPRNNMSSTCGSTGRVLTSGGYTGSYSDIIDYFETENDSAASDFGDMIDDLSQAMMANNGTKASFNGGYNAGGGAYHLYIQYVDFDTTGNATDAGDLWTSNSVGIAGSGANSGNAS